MGVIKVQSVAERGRHYLISPPRKSGQSVEISRCQEIRPSVLATLRIHPEDLLTTAIKALLASGVTAGEIVSELFAQVHNIDPEVLEFLMRR